MTEAEEAREPAAPNEPAGAGKAADPADRSSSEAKDGEAAADTPADPVEEADDANPDDVDVVATDLVDSDRLLRRVTAQLPSAVRAGSITNPGHLMAGHDNNMFVVYNGEVQPSANIRVEAISRLAERIDSFVEPAVFGDLKMRLRRFPVVDLTGAERSGRFTTACVAIARRHRAERCLEIVLSPDTDPYAIRDQADLLSEGHGYVVRLAKGSSAGLIRWLTPAFEKAQAGAVLVSSGGGAQAGHHSAEVRHAAPDPVRVFRKHLLVGLTGQCLGCAGPCEMQCIDEYVRKLLAMPAVTGSIGTLQQPRICADYARRFAEARPRAEADIESLLPLADEQRREQARSILLVAQAGGRHADRYDQHRRALRIAYATLSGRPSAQVSEAAGLLLERVDEQFGREYTGRPALTHDVNVLLGDELTAATTRREDAPDADLPVAHAHDDLVLAILGVAWNEFDHTQPALMEWVHDLALHPATEFQQAATRAAMVFAYHDFDLLWDQVIGPWAAHSSRKLRRVAAATLVSSANLPATAPSLGRAGPRIEAQADQILGRLAFSERANERDTAALAWSAGYPARHPRSTLPALTSVALNSSRWRAGTVADAVCRITDSLGAAWTVGLLDAWSRREEEALRHQAARSFFRLGMQTLQGGDQPSTLLDGLTQDPALAEPVAGLWQHLLVTKVDGTPQEVVWRILAHWLRRARNPRYAGLVHHILRRLALDPTIRPKLEFWLSNGTVTWHGARSDDVRL